MRYVLVFSLILLIQATYATCNRKNCTCEISAIALNFGEYSPLSFSEATSTGSVSVHCSTPNGSYQVSYQIDLSKGHSNNYTNRAMSSNDHQLYYNLYTSAGNTAIWGDAENGTSAVSDDYRSISGDETRSYTVYGSINSGQSSVTPGSYSDTITASIVF